MYFNKPNFRSAVINTDQFGFRMSHGPSGRASAGGDRLDEPVRLLVGGSGALVTALPATATVASRLWLKHAPARPWLNFGAPYFNSTQELMLFMLYRHLLPPVEEIVIFSGFNNLVMAQLTDLPLHGQGPFFSATNTSRRCRSCGNVMQAGQGPALGEDRAEVAGIEYRAAGGGGPADTGRHDRGGRRPHRATPRQLLVMAAATGARVSFVLQPLAMCAPPGPRSG